MGGLISLHFAERRRDVFTRVGSISPSLWAGGRLIERIEAFPLAAEDRRLWLDMGTCEGQAVTWTALQRLREILLQNGWDKELHYKEVSGARHDEWFWAARMPDILAALYPPRLIAVDGGLADQMEALEEQQAA